MSHNEEEGGCKWASLAEKTKAENREDIMKRWFAIALSVGFATALSRMPWIEKGLIFQPELPIDYTQINQMMRLMAATTATLLSWEGYLVSIRTKPLTDGVRFYIDMFLVTIYLILLLTSSSQHFWIWLHLFTFVIYIVWDFFSIKVHQADYIKEGAAASYTRASIYKKSILGHAEVRAGPLVTLIWPLYLLSVACSYQFLFSVSQRASLPVTALFFVFIIIGLLGYRSEKIAVDRRPQIRLVRVAILSVAAVALSYGLRCLGHSVPVIFNY